MTLVQVCVCVCGAFENSHLVHFSHNLSKPFHSHTFILCVQGWEPVTWQSPQIASCVSVLGSVCEESQLDNTTLIVHRWTPVRDVGLMQAVLDAADAWVSTIAYLNHLLS